jgi:hypothetical protein
MTIRSQLIGVRRALSSSGTLKLRNLSFLGRSGSWPEIIADVHGTTANASWPVPPAPRLALRATGFALAPTLRAAAAD